MEQDTHPETSLYDQMLCLVQHLYGLLVSFQNLQFHSPKPNTKVQYRSITVQYYKDATVNVIHSHNPSTCPYVLLKQPIWLEQI